MEQNEQQITPGFEQQLAEAEERGYRRGLNEQIEKKMREPALWEGPEPAAPPEPQGFEILSSEPHSIWDDTI